MMFQHEMSANLWMWIEPVNVVSNNAEVQLDLWVYIHNFWTNNHANFFQLLRIKRIRGYRHQTFTAPLSIHHQANYIDIIYSTTNKRSYKVNIITDFRRFYQVYNADNYVADMTRGLDREKWEFWMKTTAESRLTSSIHVVCKTGSTDDPFL